MTSDKKLFPLPSWHSCPGDYPDLKDYLKALGESTHIRALLDNLIKVLIAVRIKKKSCDAKNASFLNQVEKDGYRLAAILCNQKTVTYDELKVIAAKRKISSAFLPNREVANDPPYILPEMYNTQEGIDPDKYHAVLKKTENRLRDQYIKRRMALQFGPALARKKEDLFDLLLTKRVDKPPVPKTSPANVHPQTQPDLPEGQQNPNPGKDQQKARSFQTGFEGVIRLTKYYSTIEALTKISNEYHLPLPKFEKTPLHFIQLYEGAMTKKDCKLPTYQTLPTILDAYKQASGTLTLDEDLMKALGIVLVEAQKQLAALNTNVTVQEEMYLSLKLLATVRQKLLGAIRRYEQTLHPMLAENSKEYWRRTKILRDYRKKIALATAGFNPSELAHLIEMRRRYPHHYDYAENDYLNVQYYSTPEKKHEFTVNIVEGKCYGLTIAPTQVTLDTFSTTGLISHRKQDWVGFVLTADGEILIVPKPTHGKVFHSSPGSGSPVLFAGEMQVAPDGSIVAVSNYSGHYEPNIQAMEKFALYLKKRGVDTSNIRFYGQDVEKLTEKLVSVEKNTSLSEAERKLQKNSLTHESQELRLSICFQLQDNKFVKVEAPLPVVAASFSKEQLPTPSPRDMVRKLLLAGLFIALGVIALAAVVAIVVISKGIALPIIGKVLTNVVMATSPTIIPALIAGAAVLSGAAFITAAHIVGATRSLLGKARNWWNSLWGEKSDINPIKVKSEKQLPPTPVQTVDKSVSPTLTPTPKEATIASKEFLPDTKSAAGINLATSTILPTVNTEYATQSLPGALTFFKPLINSEHEQWNKSLWGMRNSQCSPEWDLFIATLSPLLQGAPASAKEVNLQNVLAQLTAHLDRLRNSIHHRNEAGSVAHERLSIWREGNILKLMLLIAENLIQSNEFTYLEYIEQHLFEPMAKTVYDFWREFKKEPYNVCTHYARERDKLFLRKEPIEAEHSLGPAVSA